MGKSQDVEYSLFRCPFCGKDELELLQADGGFFVVCYSCSAGGPSKMTAHKAIDAWNDRPFQFDTRKKKASDF